MRTRLSNGLALGYDSRGSGPVIVLLHPIGTRRQFWVPMVDHLEDRFRCISLDLRGHGDSDVPLRRFTIDELAGDVIEMLRAQEICDAAIVGCSYGGMVAQGAVLAAPDLFSAMVVTGTLHTQTEQNRAFVLARAEETQTGFAPHLDATLARWFSPGFFESRPELRDGVAAWLMAMDPVAFAWSWEAIAAVNYGDRLKEIRVPSLMLRGEHDKGGRGMPEMARLVADGRFKELPGVGHMSPFETPEDHARIIADFLDMHVRIAG